MDLNEIQQKIDENPQLKSVLPNLYQEIWIDAPEVKKIRIQSQKIEGTEDFARIGSVPMLLDLRQKKKLFSLLLDDQNYVWENKAEGFDFFEPECQLIFTAKERGFSFLFSPSTNELAMISLAHGQEKLKLKPKMVRKLKRICKNNSPQKSGEAPK